MSFRRFLLEFIFFYFSCMKQPPGKYLLLKDPQAQVVRLYALPGKNNLTLKLKQGIWS